MVAAIAPGVPQPFSRTLVAEDDVESLAFASRQIERGLDGLFQIPLVSDIQPQIEGLGHRHVGFRDRITARFRFRFHGSLDFVVHLSWGSATKVASATILRWTVADVPWSWHGSAGAGSKPPERRFRDRERLPPTAPFHIVPWLGGWNLRSPQTRSPGGGFRQRTSPPSLARKSGCRETSFACAGLLSAGALPPAFARKRFAEAY